MDAERALVVFKGRRIRRIWHDEEWYFSIIDIVAILTEQNNYLKARKYWNKLKQRLNEEGSEAVTNCHQLKLSAKLKKLNTTIIYLALRIALRRIPGIAPYHVRRGLVASNP